jgi:hypothetical protein
MNESVYKGEESPENRLVLMQLSSQDKNKQMDTEF